MINIALYEPEIPPNTGNIIRLCANTNSALHLIHPLGFELNTKQVRRAGLDYHDMARVTEHDSFEDYLAQLQTPRIFACSTKGHINYSDIQYQADDILLFGPETRGLPSQVLQHDAITNLIRIPMAKNSRSLNLSNAVAIILYEALRQNGFFDTK